MSVADSTHGGGSCPSGDPSGEGTALEIFEGFLTDYHESRGAAPVDFGALCARYPDHASLFQRWWDHLLQTGEVSAGGEADPLAELPVEGSHFGNYEILRELGRGSQGTVFLAEDSRLSRRVALKVLPAYRGRSRDRAERFAREAELASRLDHPGLCTVYERGMMGSVGYLAMRYVEGETLAACIARARRQFEVEQSSSVSAGSGSSSGSVSNSIQFGAGTESSRSESMGAILSSFEQAARALHAAHEVGLIHRDVKPGNLVVDAEGRPVILDFGLARDVESDLLTVTGDLLGTPAYMSPEQLAAHRIDLDRRTDVYSLGATLYECLTLHRPFEAATRNELYQQILVAEPTSPRRHNREIPRDLEVVLLTAIDKDRNRRYQTAEEFAEDLRRVRRLEPIHARPAGPWLRLRRWAQRRPGVAASVVAIFLLLTSGLAVSQYFYRQASHYQSAFEHLADRGTLRNAKAALSDLYPIWQARLPRLEAWLADYGRDLAGRLPEHRRQLAAVRSRALPITAAERAARLGESPVARRLAVLRLGRESFSTNRHNARMDLMRKSIDRHVVACDAEIAALTKQLESWRPYDFADRRDAAVHSALRSLVVDLEAFTGPSGLLRRVERHVAWLRNVGRGEAHAAAWRQAQEQAREIYGAELPIQEDLIPLGKNPQGLLEFADARSGAPPAKNEDGTLRVTGATAIVFVLLKGGAYEMGRSLVPYRLYHERGRVDVQLDWFFCSKYELTRGQWRRLAGVEPPGNTIVLAGGSDGDEHPVESCTWLEARDLLHEYGMLLPTEAQWEYAALAGKPGPVWWPPRAARRAPPENVADKTGATAWRLLNVPKYDDGYELAAPPGSLLPNPCGLYDTLGNVSEWCREAYLPVPLGHFAHDAGDGYGRIPDLGERTVRGANFRDDVKATRAGRRIGRNLTTRHLGVGVRPVRRVLPTTSR